MKHRDDYLDDISATQEGEYMAAHTFGGMAGILRVTIGRALYRRFDWYRQACERGDDPEIELVGVYSVSGWTSTLAIEVDGAPYVITAAIV